VLLREIEIAIGIASVIRKGFTHGAHATKNNMTEIVVLALTGTRA
jgi:hypothetical protein